MIVHKTKEKIIDQLDLTVDLIEAIFANGLAKLIAHIRDSFRGTECV